MPRIHERQKKLRTVCEPARRLARSPRTQPAASTAAPVLPLAQPGADAVRQALAVARSLVTGQSFEQDALLALRIFEREWETNQ